jgi:hypothetical protein
MVHITQTKAYSTKQENISPDIKIAANVAITTLIPAKPRQEYKYFTLQYHTSAVKYVMTICK